MRGETEVSLWFYKRQNRAKKFLRNTVLSGVSDLQAATLKEIEKII
jgi:hypothetical protein